MFRPLAGAGHRVGQPAGAGRCRRGRAIGAQRHGIDSRSETARLRGAGFGRLRRRCPTQADLGPLTRRSRFPSIALLRWFPWLPLRPRRLPIFPRPHRDDMVLAAAPRIGLSSPRLVRHGDPSSHQHRHTLVQSWPASRGDRPVSVAVRLRQPSARTAGEPPPRGGLRGATILIKLVVGHASTTTGFSTVTVARW